MLPASPQKSDPSKGVQDIYADPLTWSPAHLKKILLLNNFEVHIADKFVEHGFDGFIIFSRIFLTTPKDFEQLGISKYGDRCRLADFFKELRKKIENSSDNSDLDLISSEAHDSPDVLNKVITCSSSPFLEERPNREVIEISDSEIEVVEHEYNILKTDTECIQEAAVHLKLSEESVVAADEKEANQGSRNTFLAKNGNDPMVPDPEIQYRTKIALRFKPFTDLKQDILAEIKAPKISLVPFPNNHNGPGIFGPSFCPDSPPKRLTLSIPSLGKRPTFNLGIKINVKKVSASEPDLFIPDFLAKHLKSHQLDGVRFLWENVVQKKSGCVLAHSMGLGKTLQLVTFVFLIILYRDHVPTDLGRKILVLCPPIVLPNWQAEFDLWIPSEFRRGIATYTISNNSSTYEHKIAQLEKWDGEGGIFLIGYQMLRNLLYPIDNTEEENKLNAKIESLEMEIKELAIKGGSDVYSSIQANRNEIFRINQRQSSQKRIKELLLTKGPDLIIADEGHHIKNLKSLLTNQINRLATRHKICLTGYPLQNNLLEYFCMIDFCYPNYLVNLFRFKSKYALPIRNGSFKNSDDAAKLLAARKLHILKNLIAPIVHRVDNNLLRKTLPPKKEFIVCFELTDLQEKLYRVFLDYAGRSYKSGIFAKTTILTRILNHPTCLWYGKDGNETAEYSMVDGTLLPGTGYYTQQQCDYVDLEGSDGGVEDHGDFFKMIGMEFGDELSKKKISDLTWAKEIYESCNMNKLEYSNKMLALLEIVQSAIRLGDRTLVFSRSIPTLEFIQDMFEDKGISWYRIDGSVAHVDRTKMISGFTHASDAPWVFLISIMTGSHGINLIRANRIVLFDLGWNPCHDEQAIGRIFRFSQVKPTFVYRFQTYETIESHLYRINVYKSSMSLRVVDQRNIVKHYGRQELEKYFDNPQKAYFKNIKTIPGEDSILDNLLVNVPSIVETSCYLSFLEQEEHSRPLSEYETLESDLETHKEFARMEFYKRNGDRTKLPTHLFDTEEDQYYFYREVQEEKDRARLQRKGIPLVDQKGEKNYLNDNFD